MKAHALVRLPQDRFSVAWGVAGPAEALPSQGGEK